MEQEDADFCFFPSYCRHPLFFWLFLQV
jgi:hypothetical protein